MPAEIIQFPTKQASAARKPWVARKLPCVVNRCKVYKGIESGMMEIRLLLRTNDVPVNVRKDLTGLLTSHEVIFVTLTEKQNADKQ